MSIYICKISVLKHTNAFTPSETDTLTHMQNAHTDLHTHTHSDTHTHYLYTHTFKRV